MSATLFDFEDYREYLAMALPVNGELRGIRTRLANELQVQKGFISSVLHGTASLSLELSMRVSSFLAHTKAETNYFILLVEKARAGSTLLENHFLEKIKEVQSLRKEINERLQVKSGMSESDQLIYYSNWHYTAIHMCLRIPKLQFPAKMAGYLGISLERTLEVLHFFVTIGIAERNGAAYKVGATRIHISSASPSISKHHTNWRIRAIESLDRPNAEDLHYSLVTSISREAAQQIREIILKSIQATEPVIAEAKDEEIFSLTVDLFKLGRT